MKCVRPIIQNFRLKSVAYIARNLARRRIQESCPSNNPMSSPLAPMMKIISLKQYYYGFINNTETVFSNRWGFECPQQTIIRACHLHPRSCTIMSFVGFSGHIKEENVTTSVHCVWGSCVSWRAPLMVTRSLMGSIQEVALPWPSLAMSSLH